MADEATESLRDRGKRLRRERILAAARELLREDPVRGFTVPLLAERADVAPATIANLVGGRDDLWAAIAVQSIDSIDYSGLPDGDPQRRAWAIMDAVVDLIESDPEVFRGMILEWSRMNPVFADDPRATLVATFRLQEGDGADVSIPAVRRGELLTTGLLGAVHQWAAGLYDSASMRDRLLDLVDVFFHAQAASVEDRRLWREEK